MDYLQSFPPQTHTPYPYYYYPSWTPPQTNAEVAKPHGVFEPWAYGSRYGYTNPECHSFCNHHSYPTGCYTFRPPYSHYPPPPPPPQFHYHGPYPPFVNTFPAHYGPPQYSMEQHPGFVIGKGMPESHCCGCPNHKCNGMKATGVKVEEHDPEVKEKASELLGLSPIKNYPNSESDPRLWNGWFPYEMKNNNKSVESEPKDWNGWVPLDMNNLKSLKQGGHEDVKEKKEKIPQHGPILWVPVLDKPVEAEKCDLKENEASPKDSNYRIIPLKFPYNDAFGVQAGPVMLEPKGKEDKVVDKSIPVMQMEDKREKNTLENDQKKTKIIPVKEAGEQVVMQMEDRREKNTLEDNQKKTKSIPVKEGGEQVGKELLSHKNAEKKSSSPPKTTKLPPVCLRVDPLPRRKSRSLSPPSKEKVVKKADGISKSSSSPTMETVLKDFVSNKENGSEKQKSEVVDVVEGTPDQSKNEDINMLDHIQVPVDVPVVLNKETTAEKAELREEKNEIGKGVNEQAEENSKEAMKEKKELSSTEAAVRIQSIYRGYDVRRWEPLQKLRQIARVHEQVEELRKQITSLEFSNAQNYEKQRLLIGETIMSLLLHLDTIQGLHPSVREIRKSVARELICLEEKLDSLKSQLGVGVRPEEANLVCDARPAIDEDKCETGHDHENISVEVTDEPKDLILEKDESSGKLKESEQNHLEMSCSAVEDAEKQLVDTEAKVAKVDQQPTELGVYDVELDSAGDISVQTMPSPSMDDGILQNGSEIMVKLQMEDKDFKSSPNEPVSSILVAGEDPGEVADLVKEDSDMELQVLPPEVKEEELVTSNLKDDEATEKVGEVVNVFSVKYAESKLEESDFQLVQEKGRGEEAELVEGGKPENSLQEERSHAEVHTEAETSLKSMKVTNDTIQNNIEGLAVERKVPNVEEVEQEVLKVDEMIPEKLQDHSNPSLTVDALEIMVEQLPAKEEVEAKEFEAMNDKERIMDESCGSEVVERKVMEEKTGHTPPSANVNESENDNLLKENEKLKEMLQKLVAAGNKQLNVISNLNGRVKDLEKKLTKNKRLRMRKKRTSAGGSHYINKLEN